LAAALVPVADLSAAQPVLDYGADLQRFSYPAPVHWFEVASGMETLRMAYLDLPAVRKPNGRTVVLLHGKNFCAATWYDTAVALTREGYRVIAIDQVGFCKSSKPADFQYSFHALADLTLGLLTQAGVGRATVVGHSFGGQLAVRLALLMPARVEQLVLVAPLGLTDRLGDGGTYSPVAQLVETERKTTFDTLKAYQLYTYYPGAWRSEYDRWVMMRAGMYGGADREAMVTAQVRTSDILQTQPVLYEIDRLKVPTTFVIGMLDATGAKGGAPHVATRAAPGSIPATVDAVAARIAGAKVVHLEGLGHAPQVEDPEHFQRELLRILAR
jgi:pimeloyl-ACP methyl ester carboxylesterase